MKTYSVQLPIAGSITMHDIEATDEADAIRQARESYEVDGLECFEVEWGMSFRCGS